jgi:regulator of protease activity HflC (stomatin/prohibitin superfamily)
MRVQTETIEQPEAMSGDSVPVKVSAVVRYRIARPDRAVIEVKDVRNSVVETAQTSLRNLIGQNSVDALFKDQDKFLGALKKRIDDTTTPWGIEFQSIEIKNIEIPQGVQASMKQQADAEREKGASLDRAAAELEIARKLRAASDEIMKSPAALELRRMQMLTEIGADRNTTTIVMLPSEFIGAADTIAKIGARLSKPEPTPQSAPRDDSKSD